MKDNIENKQKPTLFTRIIVTYEYHQATRKKTRKLKNSTVPSRESSEVVNRVEIESVTLVVGSFFSHF